MALRRPELPERGHTRMLLQLCDRIPRTNQHREHEPMRRPRARVQEGAWREGVAEMSPLMWTALAILVGLCGLAVGYLFASAWYDSQEDGWDE